MHKKLSIKINPHPDLNIMGPMTPLDQTVRTPLMPPKLNPFYNNNLTSSMEDISDANRNNSIASSISDLSNYPQQQQQYSLSFTKVFDSMLLNIYQRKLAQPNLTPFNGNIPPSGLVHNITSNLLNHLINNFIMNLDHQNFLTYDLVISKMYQPILLKLFRKRLIELCSFNAFELPVITSVNLLSDKNLIIDLPLPQTQQQTIRKLSSNNNSWLQIGNLSNLRNCSTDSLQSNQDFVPQFLLNKSNSLTEDLSDYEEFNFNFNSNLQINQPNNVNKVITPSQPVDEMDIRVNFRENLFDDNITNQKKRDSLNLKRGIH